MAAKIEKITWKYWFHLCIGLGFMLIFPRLSPIEPITEVGMVILGTFIGLVYLWSTMDSIWPSLLGLMIVGLSSYTGLSGYDAVKDVFLNAIGVDTVIIMMLGMILFSALEYVGCTKYIARFFMSRKIIEGRPYVFLFIFFFCSYVIAAFTQPMVSMLILWPIAIEVCNNFDYKKGDKIFYCIICGVYLAATLGQPALPFRGPALVVTSAFSKTSGLSFSYGSYIAYSLIMTTILLCCYLAVIRFLIRPDITAFKNLTVAELTKTPLPKMNRQQIGFFIVIIAYVLAVVLPAIVPKSIPFIGFLDNIGVIGVSVFCIVVTMIIPYQGKPMLDFRGVAKKSFSWDILFMVAGGLYICGGMNNEATGIKPFLIQLLQPLLGDKPEIVFILLLFGFVLFTTNFAHNVSMAIVMFPIVLAFMDQYPAINPVVVCMSISLLAFVALLTPAASAFCAMLHARKDLVEHKEIMSLFIPMVLIALIVFTFIGYPIANVLF